MFATLYRKIVSQRTRENIYQAFLGRWLLFIRNNITEPIKAKYYIVLFSLRKPRNAREQSLKEWGLVGPCPYPYLWVKDYREQIKSVSIQCQNGLPYIWHQDKRLFFRRGTREKDILSNYLGLLIEQDKRSAHRYVKEYDELGDEVTLLDIGAAEGIFTLDVINNIKQAYLFESEEPWIEALEATFEPWKEKVTIVKKYVSDTDDEQNIRLDTFFYDKSTDDLFVKMDIEGYERKALAGAYNLLAMAKNIRGSVCIYHKKDDPEVISRLLTNANLTIEQTPNWLYMSRELRPAILRFHRKEE